MNGPAPSDVPPHGRNRWLAAIAIVAVLVGGLFAVGFSRSRASAARVQSAERAIRTALETQGAALLRGDEAAWLRTVDRPLIPEMTRLYANLRGFEVSAWLPRTTAVTGRGTDWTAETQVRVCFAAARCPESYVAVDDVITARTQWRITGRRAVLTAFDQYATSSAVPWKTETLTFAAGDRTVVAASRGGVHPATWLAVTEQAARAADRFALADPPPGKYLVFLASNKEWDAAIGENREASAFVDRTSAQTAFAVVDSAEPADSTLLTHELAHIATLLGTLTGHDTWAIEGLAEYVAHHEAPVAAYRLADDARRHIARTHWQGRLDLTWSSDPGERVGFYAMAYLAVRCLGTTYGDGRLLTFFRRLVRENNSTDQASATAFGLPWDEVQSACRPKIEAWLRS